MAWEYHIIKVPSGRGPLTDFQFYQYLQDLGSNGWRLRVVDSGVGYLERQYDPDDYSPEQVAEEELPAGFSANPPNSEAEEDVDDNPFDPGDIDDFADDDVVWKQEVASHGVRQGHGHGIPLPPPPPGHDPELTGII